MTQNIIIGIQPDSVGDELKAQRYDPLELIGTRWQAIETTHAAGFMWPEIRHELQERAKSAWGPAVHALNNDAIRVTLAEQEEANQAKAWVAIQTDPGQEF